jgi:hypothetical protein
MYADAGTCTVNISDYSDAREASSYRTTYVLYQIPSLFGLTQVVNGCVIIVVCTYLFTVFS